MLLLKLLAFFSPALFAQWNMNDVSILLPLPAAGEESFLFSATTRGVSGELLPQAVFNKLPLLILGRTEDEVRAAIRVVGLRIDPCFQEGEGPQPCQKQIRFVWQPLMRDTDGGWTTVDAAIHTFYAMDDQSWRILVAGLRQNQQAFRSLTAGLPLQIHPTIAQQGLRGPAWRQLGSLVLSLCGPHNLVRATAMTVNPMGNVWVFAGLNVAGDRLTHIEIPRTGQRVQGVFVNLSAGEDFMMTFNPVPAGENALMTLIRDSAAARRQMREPDVVEAVRRAVVMENPRLSNPGTVDCASCHSTRALPLWAAKNYPRWSWPRLFGRELYQGDGNRQNTSRGDRLTHILRAFGYFGRDPIISQRTINETSALLPLMSK